MVTLHTLRATTIGLALVMFAVPARGQETQDWQRLAASLHPGTRVELHLMDGSHVDGTLVVQDADVIVVNPRTRIPVAPWRVAYADIRTIDVKHRDGLSPGAKVLIGMGAGAAAVFFGLLIAVASLAD